CASESPDFLLSMNGKTVGIEVTEVCVPSSQIPKRQLESIENAIALSARNCAVDQAMPAVTVSLFFNIQTPMPKSRQSTIAKVVVSAVQDLMPPPGGSARIEYPSSSTSQPQEVDLILVDRHEPYHKHVWRPIKASWVLQDACELFQDSITKKSKKYSDYRKKCDECWLLIGAEGTKPSSAIRPNQSSLVATYGAPFERVFFVRLENQQVVELLVAPNQKTGPASHADRRIDG
ncbi:MAG: hypothetical protein ABL962_15285, partial [Fimbriimonadaceae bacterium]